MKKDFREKLLAKEKFIVTWELIPGRGAWESSQEKVLEQAEKAAKGNIVDAISLTDNPGGSVAIRPDIIGQEIAKFGIETIIHLTCKDKNRNQLESTLYALERAKLNNVLVLTGDYDLETKSGLPKPVFDLDSTQLLQMIQELNQGIVVKKAKGESRFKPCNFCAGAAVSPFKATEAELIMQYSKLKKKIENGAAFIITQVGYDIRKFHELFLYTRQMGWDIPLIGNLYAVNFPTGRVMNNNRVPGCVVTDKLLAELEQERQNPDKGKQAMLDRTAKLYALLKGIGYRGVHLGGYNIEYEQIEYIVGKGEELSA
ncbi:MAG: methylenetetrahydrofolate reductase, partial [Peptococcaceae bacterium]|nr:methylenetetrahydrofolate reductase [Peptococcaceae bacterium]